MKIARNVMVGIAAASLLAAPAVAAAPADRGTESAEEANGIASLGWLFAIGVIAVVALAVVAFNNDDDPASP